MSTDQQTPRPIDGKFGVLNNKIVNLVSLQEIPEDEPLFLLRARDSHAYDTLMHYLRLNAGGDDLHQEGIMQVIRRFIAFATDHPERMKQPGITRDLKLAESTEPHRCFECFLLGVPCAGPGVCGCSCHKTASKPIFHTEDSDNWRCVCGNTVSNVGFAPCDTSGKEIEPTQGRWNGLYRCNRCDSIIETISTPRKKDVTNA
jgi:hypothetical protein